MSKLQIYKASAGSGKTHLLTEFYLKLAFVFPDSFKHILAVTFTNKAADEMKGRILHIISNIIDNNEDTEHFDQLKAHLGISSVDMIEKAKLIRRNILHNFSDFHVGTIDSFIQRVIRAFAYELNLHSGYDIEFDTEKVVSDLTDLLSERIPEDENLKSWLIELIQDKIDDGLDVDIRKEIRELAKELFKEEYHRHQMNNAIEKEVSEERESMLKKIKAIKRDFESEMLKLSESWRSVLDQYHMDHTQYGRSFNVLSNFFIKKLSSKDYKVTTQTLRDSREGIEKWYAKSAKKEVTERIEEVYPYLSPLVDQFFSVLEEKGTLYHSAVAIYKQFYAYGIIEDIGALLTTYRSDNNLLMISDLTFLLKELIGHNDAPFIYEKVGNRYHQILIDEFQDTSAYQWSIFKPLIVNSLSQNYPCLVVGDVKQSIYRWRNGDWKLLLSGLQNDIGSQFVEEKSLDVNWRSRKNIVKFNNSIFRIIPGIMQEHFNHKLKERLSTTNKEDEQIRLSGNIITEAYHVCLQSIPLKTDKEGGKVHIEFFNHQDDYTEELYKTVPTRINELIEKGYKPSDIGILVRKNDEAEKVVKLIHRYLNDQPETNQYHVISPKSLRLSESGSVKVIVSALKYLNDPDDHVNLSELLYYYSVVNKKADMNAVFMSISLNHFTDYLPEAFNPDSLNTYTSLYELTERVINIFDVISNKEERPYIRALREMISEYSYTKNYSLPEFIRYWDETGVNQTMDFPESTDAVRIMTIHKSKGLAFKVVIIPFTDWRIEPGSKGPLLWVESPFSDFKTIRAVPVKYSSYLEQTNFSQAYYEEKLQSYMDALNMLYVACTRAKDELYIYSSRYKETPGGPSNIGHFLYKAVSEPYSTGDRLNDLYIEPSDLFKLETQEFLFDDAHAGPVGSSSEHKQEIIDADLNLNDMEEAGIDIFNQLKIKYKSSDFMIEFDQEIESKVNYGILMHTIFSRIRTTEDIDKVIQEMHFEGLLTYTECSVIQDKIKAILSRPNVQGWFSEGYEIHNEEALLTMSGNIKIPDRVLINEEKVIVIDFKFGKHYEKYSAQIKEYARLLEEVYNKPSEAYIYYVEDDRVERF